MAVMFTALLLALATHSLADPATLHAPPASLAVVAHRVLADDDDPRGVKRGLRNMAIGAAVLGVGCVASVAPLFLLAGVVVTMVVVGVFLLPPLLSNVPVVATLGGMATAVPASLGILVGVAGLFWLGVNSAIVMARLSPDYKPGPGTEYLDL